MENLEALKDTIKKLSISYIEEQVGGDVQKGLDLIDSLRLPYVAKPTKPILSNKATSKDALEYANLLEKYEVALNNHVEYQNEKNLINMELDSFIKNYLLDASGALNTVPVKYLDKLYSYAYRESHSNGYYSVFCTLVDLVEIFEE